MIKNGVPPVPFDLAPLLARGSLTYMTGEPKGFKTWLALDWAIALALERPFAGLETDGDHRILFVEAESTAQIPGRFVKLCRGYGVEPEAAVQRVRFMGPESIVRLENAQHAQRLLAKAKDYGATWVIIDSFVRVHGLDENVPKQMAELASGALLPLRDELGCGVLVLDHPPKPSHGHGRRANKEQIRGSWEKLAAADVHLHLQNRRGKDSQVVEIYVAASRLAETSDEPFRVRLQDTANGGLRFEPVTQVENLVARRSARGVERAEEIIRSATAQTPSLTFTGAIEEVIKAGLSRATAVRAWNKCQVSEVSGEPLTRDPEATAA